MQQSKCPKCQLTGFETVTETPLNSNFDLQIIRCKSCKTAIGVLDHYNIGALIFDLAKKLGIPLKT